MPRLLILLLLMTAAGCDNKPNVTPAMLAFEAKKQQVQEQADKAWALITAEVDAHPEAHLQEIALANDRISRSQQLFKKAGIQGVKNQDIEALKRKLKEYDRPLTRLAIGHLHTLTDKTLAIRKRVKDIRSQPYSRDGINVNVEGLIQRLSDDYNKDIEHCCLGDIERIRAILRDSTNPQAKQLVALTKGLSATLHQMIKQQDAAARFREKLRQLEKNLNDISLTNHEK